MGRILSLDLGMKRVGVAVSDPLKLIARPLVTLAFSTVPRLLEDVQALVEKEDVELVLIGYPLRADGSEGDIARLAQSVRTALEGAGLACRLWDESDSSVEAEAVIHEHGKRRKEYREKIDQIAAALILKSYLATLK